jgi:hypothetical protein
VIFANDKDVLKQLPSVRTNKLMLRPDLRRSGAVLRLWLEALQHEGSSIRINRLGDIWVRLVSTNLFLSKINKTDTMHASHLEHGSVGVVVSKWRQSRGHLQHRAANRPDVSLKPVAACRVDDLDR